MPTSTYRHITSVCVCVYAQDLDVACTTPPPSPSTSPDRLRLNGRTYPITYMTCTYINIIYVRRAYLYYTIYVYMCKMFCLYTYAAAARSRTVLATVVAVIILNEFINHTAVLSGSGLPRVPI